VPDDPEIKAMSAIQSALEPLDAEASARVLQWAAARFGVSFTAPRGLRGDGGGAGGGSRPEDVEVEPGAYEDFAELFHAANPRTDSDRGLVGAYWLQVVQKQDSFSAQTVNEELKTSVTA
jgi:hypothetical protein